MGERKNSMSSICCCFDDSQVADPHAEGVTAASGPCAGQPHPMSSEAYQQGQQNKTFQVPMKCACFGCDVPKEGDSCGSCCAHPISTFCCLSTGLTCGYGTNWCLRGMVLEWNWKNYYCCQGFAPCCQEQCDALLPQNEYGRAACMCCECFCCVGLALSASRLQLMIEYDLKPDKSDYQIIQFNNCIQCLSCICDTLAICFRQIRGCADIIRIIAHIVWMMTSGCIGGQIAAEKTYQNKRLLDPANNPLLNDKGDSHVMGVPIQQGDSASNTQLRPDNNNAPNKDDDNTNPQA